MRDISKLRTQYILHATELQVLKSRDTAIRNNNNIIIKPSFVDIIIIIISSFFINLSLSVSLSLGRPSQSRELKRVCFYSLCVHAFDWMRVCEQ